MYNRWLKVKRLAWVKVDSYKLIKFEVLFQDVFVTMYDVKILKYNFQ